MKQQKEQKSPDIFATIKRYIDLKTEYYQLAFVEKASILIGKIVLWIATVFMIFLLLAFFVLLTYNLLMSWIGISWLVALIEIAFVGFAAYTVAAEESFGNKSGCKFDSKKFVGFGR